MKPKSNKPLPFLTNSRVRTLWWSLSLGALLGVDVSPSKACSVIAGAPGSEILGGNYDWHARGGIAFLSPRRQVKFSKAHRGKKTHANVTWTSQYASLTLSQFGRDYPMQGINEKGLAGMVLMGPSAYPREGAAGVIGENIWLQYQFDMFATVAEVAEHVRDFGIKKISADLHWFFCDADGECIVVEFINGSAVVYRGADLTVKALTNTSYANALSQYSSWARSQTALPSGYDSVARFIRLAADHSPDSRERVASQLDDVAKSGFTAWQTIFGLGTASFRVRLAGDIWQDISFDNHDLSCSSQQFMLHLSKKTWEPYDAQVVRTLLKHAVSGIPESEAQAIADAVDQSERVVCR